MVTYSLAGQSVTNTASASSTELRQHRRILLPEPARVDMPSVAFQKQDPSPDVAEQQSDLNDRDQKNRFREHAFKEGEVRDG